MGPFAKYLQKCEFVLQHTMPGKLEQKGVVQRSNHTVMIKVRNTTSECSLPQSFLGEFENKNISFR